MPIEPAVQTSAFAPPDAPARLRASIDLLIGFVRTTASKNGRPERLETSDDLVAWFEAQGTRVDPAEVTTSDAASARELREAFRGVFRAHCDCTTTPVDVAEDHLRVASQRYPIRPILTTEGCTFAPSQGGASGLFGSLLAAGAGVAAAGQWSRMKICMNPSCYGGFYDKTRNLSGQYCSSACNSQMSMRAYRARQRSA